MSENNERSWGTREFIEILLAVVVFKFFGWPGVIILTIILFVIAFIEA